MKTKWKRISAIRILIALATLVIPVTAKAGVFAATLDGVCRPAESLEKVIAKLGHQYGNCEAESDSLIICDQIRMYVGESEEACEQLRASVLAGKRALIQQQVQERKEREAGDARLFLFGVVALYMLIATITALIARKPEQHFAVALAVATFVTVPLFFFILLSKQARASKQNSKFHSGSRVKVVGTQGPEMIVERVDDEGVHVRWRERFHGGFKSHTAVFQDANLVRR